MEVRGEQDERTEYWQMHYPQTKEKGITQEQLADYMGVSKASVSKWETGQSYPDIVILPKMAAYFKLQRPAKSITKI